MSVICTLTITEKENTVMTGFIAQEVEKAAQKTGYDFDGIVKPKDMTQNNYGISYASFVVPLVKAVQEQQVLIEALQKQNALLLQRLNKVEAVLNKD